MQFGDDIFGRNDDGEIDFCKRYPVMNKLSVAQVNAILALILI